MELTRANDRVPDFFSNKSASEHAINHIIRHTLVITRKYLSAVLPPIIIQIGTRQGI